MLFILIQLTIDTQFPPARLASTVQHRARVAPGSNLRPLLFEALRDGKLIRLEIHDHTRDESDYTHNVTRLSALFQGERRTDGTAGVQTGFQLPGF